MLAEFDFLSAHSTGGPGDKADGPWSRGKAELADRVDIGELAALTVANESLEMNGGTNVSALPGTLSNEYRKTWSSKYILK